MRFSRRAWLPAVGLLLVLAVLGAEQMGSITGTVKDPSGKPLAGGTVIAFNLDTGDAYDTRTDKQGLYQFLDLTAGDYELTVAHDGFDLYTSPEIKVDGKTPVRHDITLSKSSK